MRQQELSVECQVKTKDDVFVTSVVSVQYQILKDRVYDACYKLTHPIAQIRSYVFDVVRSTIPRMTLDQTFESKDEISSEVKKQLTGAMRDYGYIILKAL